MSRKKCFSVKQIFSFLSVGVFYWRLLILPFIGALLAIASLELSLNGSNENPMIPLSYPAVFYTFCLMTLVVIGSSSRDKIFNRHMMSVIVLWPVSKKEKKFWIYLRSSWLPGILLFLGALITSFFMESSNLILFFTYLPYGIAAVFLLSIHLWAGSFVTVNAGNFVGKVSSREDGRLSLMGMLLVLSPLLLDFVPNLIKLFATVVVLSMGVAYEKSGEKEIQVGGEIKERQTRSSLKKQPTGPLVENIKSPLKRYFYYLDWENLKNPLQSFLINISAVFFVVVVYYAIGGMYFVSSGGHTFERGAYISLIVSYTTFLLHYAVVLTTDTQEVEMLLPLSLKKKAMVSLLNHSFRPILYTFLNIIGTGIMIPLTHMGLSLVLLQPDVAYGALFGEILRYTFPFLILSIAAFSLLEFILRGVLFILQKFRANKGFTWVSDQSFFFYLLPLIFMTGFIGRNLSILALFATYKAIAFYGVIFLLSRVGIYWLMKRIQVISL